MGLAASQCRLLFVTSRQTDVSGKMQRISNDKMRLACDEDEVYSKFNRMYNTPKYTDLDGNDLNYNQIMGSSAATNGLTTVISDYNGHIVLSDSMASKLGLSGTGDGTQFSQKIGSLETFISKFEKPEDVEDIMAVKNGTYGPEPPEIPEQYEPTWVGHWRYACQNDPNIQKLGEYKFDKTKDVDKSVDDLLGSIDKLNINLSGVPLSPTLSINNFSEAISGNNIQEIGTQASTAKSNAGKIIDDIANAIGSKMNLGNNEIQSRVSNFKTNVLYLVQNSQDVPIDTTGYSYGHNNNPKQAAQEVARRGIIGHACSQGYSQYITNHVYCMNVGETLRRITTLLINKNQNQIDKINNIANYMHSYHTGNWGDVTGYDTQNRANTSKPTGTAFTETKTNVNDQGFTKEELESKLNVIYNWYVSHDTELNPDSPHFPSGESTMTFANALKIFKDNNATIYVNPGDGGGENPVTIPPLLQNKANYYENLYNQLKVNGWVVPGDDVITTNLNQGLYYIQDGDNEREKISESDNYLEGKDKEMQDKAQAWYEHEINKINRKEKEMDTQMNKLQTEYTALTNDRNSIEQIIQKNIEKSFKFCQSG